jgi:ubiquinone/menaquinone biosynthesis C-methylase UbiE
MSGLINTIHNRLVFGRRVRVLTEALAEVIPSGSKVLDIGCGDGRISAQVAERGEGVSVAGIDVLLRPHCHIPVTQFDGSHIPFPDASFDVVMFVDVLHHTNDPVALLSEAQRVTRKYVVLKDHFRTGSIGNLTLRAMDWFGNAHHNVVLPYNYLSEPEWDEAYKLSGLTLLQLRRKLDLYPFPASLVFGRGLHFVALLEKNR